MRAGQGTANRHVSNSSKRRLESDGDDEAAPRGPRIRDAQPPSPHTRPPTAHRRPAEPARRHDIPPPPAGGAPWQAASATAPACRQPGLSGQCTLRTISCSKQPSPCKLSGQWPATHANGQWLPATRPTHHAGPHAPDPAPVDRRPAPLPPQRRAGRRRRHRHPPMRRPLRHHAPRMAAAGPARRPRQRPRPRYPPQPRWPTDRPRASRTVSSWCRKSWSAAPPCRRCAPCLAGTHRRRTGAVSGSLSGDAGGQS